MVEVGDAIAAAGITAYHLDAPSSADAEAGYAVFRVELTGKQMERRISIEIDLWRYNDPAGIIAQWQDLEDALTDLMLESDGASSGLGLEYANHLQDEDTKLYRINARFGAQHVSDRIAGLAEPAS